MDLLKFYICIYLLILVILPNRFHILSVCTSIVASEVILHGINNLKLLQSFFRAGYKLEARIS